MHCNIVTLFPEFFSGPLSNGLMQRAQEAGIISFSLHNPRDWTEDKHKTVDDRPYGGGPGMVLLPEPMAKTLSSLGFTKPGEAQPGRLIYLSPKGKPLTQALARELAAEPSLTLVCGRYEGIDARLETLFPLECVSVGDFVLNGGEAAALCLIEAAGRLLPGFMGHEESGTEESFSDGLLEHPHYTRPAVFHNEPVPAVLQSGDHAKIARWRREMSLQVTLEHRPELLSQAPLSDADRAFLQQQVVYRPGKNLYCALIHYPVLDKYKNSVAVSLTNLDIHDIARSSCTYGLGGYYIVTPIEDQQRLLQEILQHWTAGAGKTSNPDRDEALSRVSGALRVEDVIEAITLKTGQVPFVAGTAARFAAADQYMGFVHVRERLFDQPVLVLFGTGHGLSPVLNDVCDVFLPPVRWHGGYNHLSVRAAAAIILDRILGDWF